MAEIGAAASLFCSWVIVGCVGILTRYWVVQPERCVQERGDERMYEGTSRWCTIDEVARGWRRKL